jgi:NAD(P)-dependent dehydrogenase (short-subunit alcohol dehydrogenase family)
VFGRLDFAFNNAGVEQPIEATADLTENQWDRIVRINLRGVFLCMKYEIPLMLKKRGGAIGEYLLWRRVKGFKGQAAYAAAKHGAIGLTKSRQPLTTRRRRSASTPCAPGSSVGRTGMPEEIAAAAVWLCSEAAAFVIGHAMVVDGGQTV